MARSTYGESRDAQTLDHESEYPVDAPEGLEHLVDAPSAKERNRRRETLADQADIEGTDPTWEEFQEMILDPRGLYGEVVELMQSLRDINYRHQELKDRFKEKTTEALKQEALIEGLLARQSRQSTPSNNTSDAIASGKRSTKLPDPPKFSGKLESGTTFEDWLVQVKNKLRGNQDHYTTEDIRVIYVAGLLQGDALALVTPRLDPDHACYYGTVKELYRHLSELYADPNRAKNARADFKKLYMKKDQAFQEFYAQFLRLTADGNIPKQDLKEELNDKLSWKLQEAVTVYYNDTSINVTRFAQYCITIDQQSRGRAEKIEKANRKGNQSKRGQSGTEEPTTKGRATSADKDKASGSSTTTTLDRPLPKCYNCGKFGHLARSCYAPKKLEPEQGRVAQVEAVNTSGSENDCP
jgi:hypothetical protein